ncbi:MAG: efflux RND transporter permease subunit [Nitrospiraceae bacterium]
MFQPLAYTIIIALMVSLALSLTLSPVLCALALERGSEEDTFLLRWAKRLYVPTLQWAMTHRFGVLAIAVGLLGRQPSPYSHFLAGNSFRSSTRPPSRRRSSAFEHRPGQVHRDRKGRSGPC